MRLSNRVSTEMIRVNVVKDIIVTILSRAAGVRSDCEGEERATLETKMAKKQKTSRYLSQNPIKKHTDHYKRDAA